MGVLGKRVKYLHNVKWVIFGEKVKQINEEYFCQKKVNKLGLSCAKLRSSWG
jgi:hypothetical protein